MRFDESVRNERMIGTACLVPAPGLLKPLPRVSSDNRWLFPRHVTSMPAPARCDRHRVGRTHDRIG